MKFRNVVAIASTLTVLASGLTILEAFQLSAPVLAQRVIAQRGDSGDEVLRIQQALARLNFFRRGTTGNFGSVTQTAVIEFQRSRDLPATGIVDEATYRLLFSLAGSDSSQDRRCSPPNSTELCPYVVMIPASPDSFNRIKQELVRGGHLSQAVANAQMEPENHPRGPIIRLGDYPNRTAAENFARPLRNYSPDIRVEYLPRRTR